MATHRISVTVGTSTIQVDPNSLVMTSADEVYWAGNNPRAFTIEFDNDGPFGQKNLTHERALSRNKPTVKGRFKYTVVSAEDPGLRLDPDIIIEDPPTGQQP